MVTELSCDVIVSVPPRISFSGLVVYSQKKKTHWSRWSAFLIISSIIIFSSTRIGKKFSV